MTNKEYMETIQKKHELEQAVQIYEIMTGKHGHAKDLLEELDQYFTQRFLTKTSGNDPDGMDPIAGAKTEEVYKNHLKEIDELEEKLQKLQQEYHELKFRRKG